VGRRLGLPYVENERWGGLILTLLLRSFGVAFAFPLSILLALGRRSGCRCCARSASPTSS
jgi:general L-amino acid transport system permease protein